MIKKVLILISIISLGTWAQNSKPSLKEVSAHMNKTLPEIFDPVTKLISTSVENNNFKYHFILNANDTEYAWAMPKVKSKILDSICKQSRERNLLLNHKANIIYSYENVQGHLLGEFMIKADHCRTGKK